MLIDEDSLGQVKFVRLFEVTALNLHVITMKPEIKVWSPYSCNGRKHRCKHVSDSVLSSFDLIHVNTLITTSQA